MSEDTGARRGKYKSQRGFRSFRQAGALIEPQTRAAAARRGFAEARLKALWPEIAGPEIASLAWPVRLASARGPAGGLLTLGVLGANGPRMQMMLPLVRERINAALGAGAVGRIQMTQAAPERMAPLEPFAPPAPCEPPDLSPLAGALSSIGDADLRAALETLARNVLSRSGKIAAREN
jgi:hypothetical protein